MIPFDIREKIEISNKKPQNFERGNAAKIIEKIRELEKNYGKSLPKWTLHPHCGL